MRLTDNSPALKKVKARREKEKEYEKVIQRKLREIAIRELKEEGVLDKEGKLVDTNETSR